MANVLCVLYDDPVDGYPPAYARDGDPEDRALPRRPERADARRRIDFTPGELLGSVSGELGLREFLEARRPRADRHRRQGRPRLGLRARAARGRGRHLPALLARLPDRRADRQGAEAEAGAHRRDRLRPRRPAGGDGRAASPSPRSPTRNSISVAEHVVMMILGLVRNYIPSYQMVLDGGWNIADCVSRSYDLEGMQVGTRRRRADRLGGAAAPEAVRRRPPLHRPPPRCRAEVEEELGRHLPRRRRVDGRGLRRGHDQRAAAPGDREPLRRGDAGEDEARRLPDQHRARQDLRPRRGRRGLRERPAGRLRRRRLVPAAGARATTPGGRCPTTA